MTRNDYRVNLRKKLDNLITSRVFDRETGEQTILIDINEKDLRKKLKGNKSLTIEVINEDVGYYKFWFKESLMFNVYLER